MLEYSRAEHDGRGTEDMHDVIKTKYSALNDNNTLVTMDADICPQKLAH